MIVERYWYGKWDFSTHERKRWRGWFLLGFIPLYVKRIL